jgi:hypothetical protein
MDTSAAESSVSLKLEEIQRRCSRLIDQPEGLSELKLEDAAADQDVNDPYNQLNPFTY